MNDDRRFFDLLSDVLAAQPRIAPDGLLTAALEDVGVATQRGRRAPAFRGRSRGRRSSPWRLAIAAVLVCVLASVALVGLTPLSGLVFPPPIESAAPTPSAVATPTSTVGPSTTPSETPVSTPRSPSPATPMDSLHHMEPGVTYVSDVFLPRMTFQVNPRSPDGVADDWCTPIPTTARMMRFAHPKTCVDDMLVVRPRAVECGTLDSHPDAAGLARAIVSNPRMAGAVDLGSLQDSDAVPAGMFAEAYQGRVVQVPARLAPFVGGQSCTLLDDRSVTQPLLEINGDLSMRLVIVEVHGELVVFRIGSNGCCNDSLHLLRITHDIRFD